MIIVWTEQATRGWHEVADYILRDFGYNRLKEFIQQTKDCESEILNYPNSGAIAWDDSSVTVVYRYRIINRLSKMLYFVIDDTIYIADFWDVRSSH